MRVQEQEQERQRRNLRMGVSSGVQLLANEGREITAAAIAAILDDPAYPEDEIADALAEMRASGEYDDSVARGLAMRGDAAG
jgi:hypothetical protein